MKKFTADEIRDFISKSLFDKKTLPDRDTSTPRISVVTPSYSQGQFIENTILSVKKQNYSNIEHIIIDGGSTDNTIEILEKYRHLRWISEPDKGQSNALNKGFKMADGEIIGWLNSDDLFLPDVVKTVVNAFQNNKHIDIVYGDFLVIDEYGKTILKKKEITFDFNILLYYGDYIGQPTVFFKRKILDRIGYLDENLHYGMDWEFWLRMASYGFKFKHIPVLLAACRWHQSAKTVLQPPRLLEENQIIRRKYWTKKQFKSQWLDSIYFHFLKQIYRGKRQLMKLFQRGCLDFPPGNFYFFLSRRKR